LIVHLQVPSKGFIGAEFVPGQVISKVSRFSTGNLFLLVSIFLSFDFDRRHHAGNPGHQGLTRSAIDLCTRRRSAPPPAAGHDPGGGVGHGHVEEVPQEFREAIAVVPLMMFFVKEPGKCSDLPAPDARIHPRAAL
jgi:hypothetical protein